MASRKKYDIESELHNLTEELKDIKAPKGPVYSLSEIIPFKDTFKEINNCITKITTKKFAEKLIIELDLSCWAETINKNIEETNPNTNGYDFEFDEGDKNIIAEVKCNIPVNGESGFGAAQKTAIIKDLINLANPEEKTYRKHRNESAEYYKDYYKFMVFLRCNDHVERAVEFVCCKWNKDYKSQYDMEIEIIESLDKAKTGIINVVIIDPD